jgi:hypothetical protein
VPRCGGCEGVCRCSVEGTDAISVEGSGQPANPYIVDAQLSSDVGNNLEVRSDGLFVGAEVTEGLFVGAGIDGDGTVGDPIVLDPASVSIYGSTGINVPHNATTALTFTAVDHEVAADMVDLGSAAGTITIPATGVYRVEADVFWAGFTADSNAGGHIENRTIAALLNGAAFPRPLVDYGNPPIPYVVATADYSAGMYQRLFRTQAFTAGDDLTLVAVQRNAGSNVRTVLYRTFTVTYIGPTT